MAMYRWQGAGSSSLVCTYTYDPWGKLLSVKNSSGTALASTTYHVSNYNPFRYRSYYYDIDTELYYLQSRYYDPAIGRFINADGYVGTGQGLLGYNMFAYCRNNPASRSDNGGYRDCAAPTVSGESSYDRSVSCGRQNQQSQKRTLKDPIGSYSQGDVYVVTEAQKTETMKKVGRNDVVIVDYRTTADPNMQIIHSYRINDSEVKKEIVQLMLDYNDANPVEPAWVRTFNSLVIEWDVHNDINGVDIFGIGWNHTKDCDFNNADEGKGYLNFIIEGFMKLLPSKT